MDYPFLNLNGRLVSTARPLVMGIVNITSDSFYAASRVEAEADAVRERVRAMVAENVDIIDVGACSTRPGSEAVEEAEEWKRLSIALRAISEVAPGVPVSVDTFRSGVAVRAVEEFGVSIINDVSGGDADGAMWRSVARLQVAYVAMHMRGTPAHMQQLTQYDNVVADVLSALARKVDALRQLGVADVIVDPGFGFAKTVKQNYELLDRLEIFRSLECPVLAAMSHKSMIFRPLGITPDEAGDATVALDALAMYKGADIVRVHEVRPAAQTARLIELMRNLD